MDPQNTLYEILTAPSADKLLEKINEFLTHQQGSVQQVFSDGDSHFAHMTYTPRPILVPPNLPFREASS